MNCANHPDLPVSAYCQNCGKPLCTQCVRSVAGVVYCEPCLAARLHPGSAYSGGASGSASGAASRVGASAAPGSAAWGQVPVAASRAGATPSPVLAGFLGLIPGVGAMYNGQFVKAFAHVIIFVILVSITDHFDAAGILVAAWVFYQVFDAVQTAIARRDGTLMPDPFGLNDLGQRLGMPPTVYTAPPAGPGVGPTNAEWASQAAQGASQGAAPGASSGAATGFVPEAGIPFAGAGLGGDAYTPQAGAAQTEAGMGAPFTSTGYTPGAPLPPAAVPYAPYVGRSSEPIGAIVLIGVGVLFLLSTLGVFRLEWIGRGWPVLIILIGAGLLFSRVRATRRAGGGL